MKRRDKPTFNEPTRHVGLQLETGLYEAVKQLALLTGVSMNYAIRRALIDMVNAGVVSMAGEPREEETARVADSPLITRRLQELEADFERVRNELASLKDAAVHVAASTRTPIYDGAHPARRPRIALRAPVARVR